MKRMHVDWKVWVSGAIIIVILNIDKPILQIVSLYALVMLVLNLLSLLREDEVNNNKE